MTTWRPGYRTTEAAFTVLAAIGLIASSAADWLPPRYAAIGTSVAVAAYNVSRGLAKIGPKPVAPLPTLAETSAQAQEWAAGMPRTQPQPPRAP